VTPLDPAPTEVVLKVDAAGPGVAVPLSPDAKDPNRFVSAPGKFPNGLAGTIHAKIDGADVEETFSSR
jgi:hypothetical protein